MPGHRPNSSDIAGDGKNLLVISRKDFLAEVNETGRDVNPHEGEVPLQRAAQPAADCECLWPVQKILLGNLRPETRKRAKDLQAAADQHEQCNRMYPVRKAYDPGMLVDRLNGFSVFGRFHFDHFGMHACPHEIIPAIPNGSTQVAPPSRRLPGGVSPACERETRS